MQNRNLIGAEWVSAASGQEIDVVNPATDEVIARVPDSGTEETRRAIDAASKAFPAWRAQTAGERAKVLRRFADFIMRDQDRLARLMTDEQGKPLAESKGEIAYAASFIEWAGEEGKRLYGAPPAIGHNTSDDVGQGRLIPTMAVDQYASTLARWFGVSDGDLSTVLPNIGNYDRSSWSQGFV